MMENSDIILAIFKHGCHKTNHYVHKKWYKSKVSEVLSRYNKYGYFWQFQCMGLIFIQCTCSWLIDSKSVRSISYDCFCPQSNGL